MIVSILVFSLVNILIAGWMYTGNEKIDNLLRFGVKILMLPVVAGVSYEVLRLLAKTKCLPKDRIFNFMPKGISRNQISITPPG